MSSRGAQWLGLRGDPAFYIFWKQIIISFIQDKKIVPAHINSKNRLDCHEGKAFCPLAMTCFNEVSAIVIKTLCPLSKHSVVPQAPQ